MKRERIIDRRFLIGFLASQVALYGTLAIVARVGSHGGTPQLGALHRGGGCAPVERDESVHPSLTLTAHNTWGDVADAPNGRASTALRELQSRPRPTQATR